MDVAFPTLPDTPVGRCLAGWHEFLGGDRGALERIVAEDAVFQSPVLYRAQHGRDLVVLYLTGASMSFGGDGSDGGGATTADQPPSFPHPSGEPWDGRFRYVRFLIDEHDAVLEFETTMKGTYVNGVDLIRCDDEGLITDFKVMIRPLRALDAVRELMMAALGALQGDDAPSGPQG